MKEYIVNIFVGLITFLLGMYIGLIINNLELIEKDEKINNLYIEIDSLKETIYMQQVENKRGINIIS